jgi:hypothetical protein
MRRMWQIWPGTLSPATLRAERCFIADLESRISRPSKATRDDVTALISMLRCGATVEEAFAFAPGLTAGKLLGAHRRIDTLRASSVAAWSRIVDDPTRDRWRADSRSAARLFPIAVERVVVALETDPSPRRLKDIVCQVQDRMLEVTNTAAVIERRLGDVSGPSAYATSLASALFTPHGPCIYSDPFFVPDRVATLSPTRVGDLLGEARN